MNRQKRRAQRLIYSVLSIAAIIQSAPLVLVFLNAFRTNNALKESPIGLPRSLSFHNVIQAWIIGGYSKAFSNSLIVSVTTTIALLIIAICAGYFMAVSKGWFSGILMIYFGVALSIPVFAFLVPLYYQFSRLNLVNSHMGLILIFVATNMPFNILLARTYILSIPEQITEAAIIDGAGIFQVILKIIVPLSKPILTTITLIVFVATWNEFTIANTFLQEASLKTAATKYVLFVGERGSDLTMVYTAGIITLLPIVLLFVCLQNYFIEGLTSGSIK